MENVNIQGTDLRMIDFQEANLQDADLRGADLRGADFQKTILCWARLQNIDLRRVKNLDTAELSRARIKGAKFPEGYEPPADADTTSD